MVHGLVDLHGPDQTQARPFHPRLASKILQMNRIYHLVLNKEGAAVSGAPATTPIAGMMRYSIGYWSRIIGLLAVIKS